MQCIWLRITTEPVNANRFIAYEIIERLKVRTCASHGATVTRMQRGRHKHLL
jgi:hypothetical protein